MKNKEISIIVDFFIKQQRVRWMSGLVALIIIALIAGCSPIQVEQDNNALTDQAEPQAEGR